MFGKRGDRGMGHIVPSECRHVPSVGSKQQVDDRLHLWVDRETGGLGRRALSTDRQYGSQREHSVLTTTTPHLDTYTHTHTNRLRERKVERD